MPEFKSTQRQHEDVSMKGSWNMKKKLSPWPETARQITLKAYKVSHLMSLLALPVFTIHSGAAPRNITSLLCKVLLSLPVCKHAPPLYTSDTLCVWNLAACCWDRELSSIDSLHKVSLGFSIPRSLNSRLNFNQNRIQLCFNELDED